MCKKCIDGAYFQIKIFLKYFLNYKISSSSAGTDLIFFENYIRELRQLLNALNVFFPFYDFSELSGI